MSLIVLKNVNTLMTVHVNGGFTWLNRSDIFVFRSKEFCK